jgi:hypothetical protein
MLEYWNAGKLGKEKMTQCIIAKIARGNDVIKWTPSFTNPTFQPSNIPPFHYSMVAAKALISILLKNKRYFIKQG